MNKLAIPVILTVFLLGLFIYGTVTQSIVPMMASFCGWTPVAWFLGYRVATAGIRVSISTQDAPPAMQLIPKPKTRRAKQRRVLTELQD